MNIDKEQYKKYAAAHAPKSPMLKNCTLAFLIGGSICTFGEFLVNLYIKFLSLPQADASTLSSVTLIFIAVALTAI